MFVSHYSRLMRNVPIYVIEQADDKPFNRAKLFNIGIHLYGGAFTNFIFHDVDLLIDTKRSQIGSTYGHTDGVVHTGTNLGQFGYRMPCKDFFGGVNIMHIDVLNQVNGWSNLIWGWGNEEEFMQEDLIKNGYEIERRTTFYHSLPHDHKYISNEQIRESAKVRKAGKDNSIDGLSNLDYSVVGVEDKGKYVLIKVSL